jgi:small subunit ribosomal protein S7
MSRRHSAEKREINPDPKFGDLVITKFMNAIMMRRQESQPPSASSMVP